VIDEVDALLQQGHFNLVTRLHSQIPRMFSDGKRLQMIVCSATLHNFDVKKLAEKLMFFPTWVDLKVIIIYFQNIIRKINNLFEKHINY
jgi:ATP-dependent RNA helicase DDX1